MSSPYALDGCIENAEHGDGVTLLGGWVRLPPAAIAAGGVRLRLTTKEGLRQEWPLARMLPRRDLPAQADAPAGRGFQLLVPGLPDWSEGRVEVVHGGGEITLHPPALRPTPFRPRGHLDGADAREAWGWLVHAPGTEAVIEMEGLGRLPVRCDIHRADLPFDDGSALPLFGFHLVFAGTPLADGQGPRRVSLRAAGVALGEVLLEGARVAQAPPAAPAASRVSGLLAERAAPAAAPSPVPSVAPRLAPSPSPPAVPSPIPPVSSSPTPPFGAAPASRAAPADITLALDSCQAVGDGMLLVAGWLEWVPDGTPPELRLCAGGTDAPPPSVILCDPPAGAAAARPGRARQGFLLVGARPASEGAPGLRIRAAGQAASLPLPGDAHGPSAEATLHNAPWGAVFELLQAAAAGGPAAALLAPHLGPAGAFTRWLAGVPWLEPADFQRVETWAAPSGECALGLTLDPPIGLGTGLGLLALLPEEGRVRPLSVMQGPPLCSETMLLAHGVLPDLTETPAPPFELLMELRHAGERQWFRVSPRPLPAPRLLDALHRFAGLPEGPDLSETLAWLRDLLDRRLESIAALLLGAAAPDPPRAGPRLVVLHGLDDPYAVRLLSVAAPAIEARADAVLLLGPREFTQPGLELFLQRRRIAAHGGAGLAALRPRTQAPAGGLAILDMLELAQALEADTLDAALAPRLPAAALSLLTRLAAVAGLPDAADAVARLASVTGGAGGERGFGPEDGAAARMVTAHLHAIWRGVAHLFLPEAAHGRT